MSYTRAELMEKNLLQVWSERDPRRRKEVIKEIYREDSTFFELEESATGYEAINEKIDSVLSNLPADFVFRLMNPVLINHDMGRLLWEVGPPNGPGVATGMDIAFFKDERIKSLYVFLDKADV